MKIDLKENYPGLEAAKETIRGNYFSVNGIFFDLS